MVGWDGVCAEEVVAGWVGFGASGLASLRGASGAEGVAAGRAGAGWPAGLDGLGLDGLGVDRLGLEGLGLDGLGVDGLGLEGLGLDGRAGDGTVGRGGPGRGGPGTGGGDGTGAGVGDGVDVERGPVEAPSGRVVAGAVETGPAPIFAPSETVGWSGDGLAGRTGLVSCAEVVGIGLVPAFPASVSWSRRGSGCFGAAAEIAGASASRASVVESSAGFAGDGVGFVAAVHPGELLVVGWATTGAGGAVFAAGSATTDVAGLAFAIGSATTVAGGVAFAVGWSTTDVSGVAFAVGWAAAAGGVAGADRPISHGAAGGRR